VALGIFLYCCLKIFFNEKINKMKKFILISFSILFFTSCSNGISENWIYPFKKEEIKFWRGYNKESLPATWSFNEEVVIFQPISNEMGDDIIFTKTEFRNFEFYIEWKIDSGGNSGILYHVEENENFPVYLVGQEYQIIDDYNFISVNFGNDLKPWRDYMNQIELYPNDKLHELQQTGALYAMYPAQNKKINDIGQWNSSRIIFKDEKVEFHLNGKLITSFIPWSNDWYDRLSQTKAYADTPFGKNKSGYICLQDHGSPVFFRNCRIRKL